MKLFSKIYLWSYLVFGILFLFIGIYLVASGRSSEGVIKTFIIAGTGQLVLFGIAMLWLNRDRLRNRDDSD